MSAATVECKEKMGPTQRRLCELLEGRHGLERSEIAAGMGTTCDGAKWALRNLLERGFIENQSAGDGKYRLTGKPFPRLEDYAMHPRAARRVQRREPVKLLEECVVSMVRAARAAEGASACA